MSASVSNANLKAKNLRKHDGKIARFHWSRFSRDSCPASSVVYSEKYDACDVTLNVYLHRASLKNMPGHGGNRTYDLWKTSPMLCHLRYAVRSVRVCDISELSLVPSISM